MTIRDCNKDCIPAQLAPIIALVIVTGSSYSLSECIRCQQQISECETKHMLPAVKAHRAIPHIFLLRTVKCTCEEMLTAQLSVDAKVEYLQNVLLLNTLQT